MPKMMPIRAEMPKEMTTLYRAITVSQPANTLIALAMATPKMMPIIPPVALTSTVSLRNCPRMSCSVAPRARRMPISLVRSVTLASMMFMMPMPPTSKEMAAMEPMTMLNTFWVLWLCASNSAGMMIS